jgi:uncharacterized protein YdeI (YjbR/CyaY-like superfamily)
MASTVNSPHYFESAKAFQGWLDTHASTANELLVGYHKVATGRPCMSWSESVDEALCVGWIDGVRRRIDDSRYSIRFTPRKANSVWSAINISKFEQLRAQGRMTAAGEAAFARRSESKSRIYAHEQASVAKLLSDEIQAFKQQEFAWHFFDTSPPGYQKIMLHWITTAKRAETRVSRLTRLIEACALGKRLR